MNIAILISSLRFGGAEKQAVIDAQMLAKQHEVVLFSFGGGPLREQLPPSVRYIEIEKKNYLLTAWRLARQLRALRIDLIHAHLFAPMLISGLATLFCRTVAVWNFHSHAYQDANKGRIPHSLVAQLPGVKWILFPAHELQIYYRAERFAFPMVKQRVFFNSGQFWDRQVWHDVTNGTVTVGFIGRIIPLKRVHLLVELASRLRKEGNTRIRISIVGDGDTLPALREQARQAGVDELVTFHGFQTDTPAYYRQFGIYALPSEEEVLSLSLIDAQLSGLPAVAFDVGGNGDIVASGETGFIVEREEQFVARIRELVTDDELRRRMGQQAIEQSSEKFSQRARLANLNALYQEAIDR